MHPWVTAEMGEVPVYLSQRPQFVEPDDRFLQQLPSYGCDIEKVKLDLQGGVFNPETSVYHLLVEKARVELEKQQLRQQELEQQQRAMMASRAALSSRGRRSQHQIPPPFDPTAVPLASPGGPQGSTSDEAAAAAAAAAAAFAHMQRVRNSRKTVAGNTENEMQAARARFMNGAMDQQQMQALSSRLTPVALTQSQPQLSGELQVSIQSQPSVAPGQNEIVWAFSRFLFFLFSPSSSCAF